jgi:hypothetical protein
MWTPLPPRPLHQASLGNRENPQASWSRRGASQDEVRALDYRIYELDGRKEGHAEQNWLQAKEELRAWGRTV